MDSNNQSSRDVSGGGDLAELLLLAMDKSTTLDDWLSRVIPLFCRELKLDLIGLVQQSHGRWVMQAWNQDAVAVSDRSFPENLVAQSLDEGKAALDAAWFVHPVSSTRNEDSNVSPRDERSDQLFFGAAAVVFHQANTGWHQESEQVKRVDDAEIIEESDDD